MATFSYLPTGQDQASLIRDGVAAFNAGVQRQRDFNQQQYQNTITGQQASDQHQQAQQQFEQRALELQGLKRQMNLQGAVYGQIQPGMATPSFGQSADGAGDPTSPNVFGAPNVTQPVLGNASPQAPSDGSQPVGSGTVLAPVNPTPPVTTPGVVGERDVYTGGLNKQGGVEINKAQGVLSPQEAQWALANPDKLETVFQGPALEQAQALLKDQGQGVANKKAQSEATLAQRDVEGGTQTERDDQNDFVTNAGSLSQQLAQLKDTFDVTGNYPAPWKGAAAGRLTAQAKTAAENLTKLNSPGVLKASGVDLIEQDQIPLQHNIWQHLAGAVGMGGPTEAASRGALSSTRDTLIRYVRSREDNRPYLGPVTGLTPEDRAEVDGSPAGPTAASQAYQDKHGRPVPTEEHVRFDSAGQPVRASKLPPVSPSGVTKPSVPATGKDTVVSGSAGSGKPAPSSPQGGQVLRNITAEQWKSAAPGTQVWSDKQNRVIVKQ